MAYFDHTAAVNLQLLHPDVQTHGELDQVSALVEKEVLQKYRRRGRLTLRQVNSTAGAGELYYYTENGVYYTIMLLGHQPTLADAAGYAADASSNADPANFTGFADAMRRTVARVTSHRLRYHDAESGIESERDGRRSRQYRTGRDTRWPPAWDSLLRDYDYRKAIYYI